MSDTYDHNHSNGSGTEPDASPEAGHKYLAQANEELEAARKSLEATQEEIETQEAVEKPKPKKKGRPKGAKTKAAKTEVVKKPKKKAKTKAKEASIPLDDFGFRKGSIRSKAATLYARAQGATLNEIKAKLGSVQYVTLTELKNRGFKVTSKQEDGKANRPATRFFLLAKKR